MPSASEILYENSCWGCGRKFRTGQEVYSEQPYGDEVFVYCEDCFVKALMIRIDDIEGGEGWLWPYMQLYKRLFPGEKTSKYVKPLMRAMTALYLKNWNKAI